MTSANGNYALAPREHHDMEAFVWVTYYALFFRNNKLVREEERVTFERWLDRLFGKTTVGDIYSARLRFCHDGGNAFKTLILGG